MDSRSSTSRYILTALAIILVFTAFVLIGLNALTVQKQLTTAPPAPLTSTDTFAAGYKAARAQFSGMCPTVSMTNQSMSGTVVSISGSSLVVHQDSLPVNQDVDGVDDNRTVQLTSDSKIIRNVKTDAATLATEQQAFQEALQKNATSTHPSPPLPFSQQTLQLSDIHVGDRVMVQSDTDLTLNPNITANLIQDLQ